MSSKKILRGGQIFYRGQFVRDHEVVIENEIIAEIRPIHSKDTASIDLEAHDYLVPAFTDLHIHGANGRDVMDARTESLQIIADTLLQEGVTGFLATTMTESLEKIEAALSACYEFRKNQKSGAALLGVHLEGPFLSEQYMGAQCGDYLRSPDISLLIKWQKKFPDLIKLITIAPELPGAVDFIRYARSEGIIISVGHTSATFAETMQGIDAGASYATHLFNAMSGVHHREPGAAAAILYDERIIAELILDGAHLVPEMVNFCVKCKGLAHLILVTDAMRAKCLKAGVYDLGGQNVVVNEDGIARLQNNGRLAGSTLRLNQALRNMQKFTQLPLSLLVPLVSSRPCEVLNLTLQGQILPKFKANLVILDSSLNVKETIYHGQIAWNS